MIPAKDSFLTAIERQPTSFYLNNLEDNDYDRHNLRSNEISLQEETTINTNQVHSSDQEAFEASSNESHSFDSQHELISVEPLRKAKRQKSWIPYRYRRRLNIIPKLISRDIRREYPTIHAHVQNSFDPQFYKQYLHRFCLPEMFFQLTNYFPQPGYMPAPFIGKTVGFENLVAGYKYITERNPDTTFEVSNIRIIQKLFTSEIVIVYDLIVTMTDPYHSHRNVEDINIFRNTFNLSNSDQLDILDVMMTKKSKKVGRGTMVMHVNDNGLISKMFLTLINSENSI